MRVLGAIVVSLTLAACDAPRGLIDTDAGRSDGAFDQSCTTCHGEGSNPAPPRALNGKTGTDEVGVGAHRLHLIDNAITLPVACSACHAVPDGIDSAGHLDRDDPVRAELRFSGRALLGGAEPRWDHDQRSCSATYCHGDTRDTGGAFTRPVWTRVDGAQRACDACHGAPPAGKHPTSRACEQCHATVAGPGHLIVDRALHIDGRVEVALAPSAPCDGCHGAPPTAPDSKHPDPKITDKCELCHAATVGPGRKLIPGGAHRNGKVDVALPEGDCTLCHGAPPAGNGHADHPRMNRCAPCHPATVQHGGTLVPGGAHANGSIDVQLPTACNACHGGSSQTGMPPPDHNGRTDPGLRSVGAHAAHVLGKKASGGGLACQTCHELPDAVDTPGHLTGTLQTVVFPEGGGLASHGGATPVYDPQTGRCSNVYCHGATLKGGGQHHKPAWTDTNYGCDACHGNPPPSITGHPQDKPGDTKWCAECHAKTVDKDGRVRTDTGAHVNGWVDK